MIEKPAKLPLGWVLARLGNVSSARKVSTNPQEKPNEEFNYLSIGNIESGTGNLVDFRPTLGRNIESLKLVFKKSDVLYSKLRPYLNKVFLPDFDGISSTDLIPIQPREGIERKYLGYYLRTRQVVEYANERLRGIQLPRIPTKDLFALPIPIAPTNEQKRIVAKVEDLFAESKTVRKALYKIPILLQRFRHSVLIKAFRGKLIQQNPSDEPAGKLLKGIEQARCTHRAGSDISSLPELPLGWAWTRLSEIACIERGKFGHRPRNDPRFYGGHYPFIQTGDIARSNGRIAEFRQTLNEDGFKISKMFKRGTIVMAIAANIGDTAILTFDACATDSVVGITALESVVSPKYLEFYLRTRKIDLQNFAPATAQRNINLRILNPLPIPIAPRREQERIVSKIEELFSFVDRIEKIVDICCDRIDEIDQVVLAKAFRGLLISQGPHDESASILLHRIRSSCERTQEKAHRPKMGRQSSSAVEQEPQRQFISLEAIVREKGEATVEQVLEVSGLSIDDFWGSLKTESQAGRIEQIRRGKLVFLRVKS